MRRTYDEEGAKALTANFLKGLLRKKGMTYRAIAKKLRSWGWEGNPQSLANRLSRGGFSAGFFIIVLKALDEEGVKLSDVERLGLKTEERALSLKSARLEKMKSRYRI